MAAPAPKVRAKAHASRKRYAVGSHRLGEAHITLLSLKEKWTVRARRGGRAALAAAPRVRIFKVAREPKTGARRESLSSVTRFKGGLWLSGFRFERREQPVSTCVRLCTLKPALWQETCCRPHTTFTSDGRKNHLRTHTKRHEEEHEDATSTKARRVGVFLSCRFVCVRGLNLSRRLTRVVAEINSAVWAS